MHSEGLGQCNVSWHADKAIVDTNDAFSIHDCAMWAYLWSSAKWRCSFVERLFEWSEMMTWHVSLNVEVSAVCELPFRPFSQIRYNSMSSGNWITQCSGNVCTTQETNHDNIILWANDTRNAMQLHNRDCVSENCHMDIKQHPVYLGQNLIFSWNFATLCNVASHGISWVIERLWKQSPSSKQDCTQQRKFRNEI